jgi:hypothetical protein
VLTVLHLPKMSTIGHSTVPIPFNLDTLSAIPVIAVSWDVCGPQTKSLVNGERENEAPVSNTRGTSSPATPSVR